MSAKTAGALISRMIGAWLVISSVIWISYQLFLRHRAAMLGMHTRWYEPNPVVDMKLHDTYYLLTPYFGIVGLAARLAVGSLLLFAAKPIGRIFAWKLDNS